MGRVRDFFTSDPFAEKVERVEPLEGTNMSLFNSIIPDWWSENVNGSTMYGTPDLANRVWVANRCQQMNAQQIASMPLVFNGATEPEWVSSPDPNWFPNGVGDAVHSIIEKIYGWGFACLLVTQRYADGFPRNWTVLDSSRVGIEIKDGARAYKYGEVPLNAKDVIQIDRNPGTTLHGTSALRAYAQQAWGLVAAGNQSMVVNQGGIPKFYLKSERKLTPTQAEELQVAWMTAVSRRNGAPPVLPPEVTPSEMSFDPSDLALLDTQEFNAKAIASAYGVPSVLLNMALEGGLTYQNPAALGEMWWRFELRPTATKVANAFTAQLLPRGQFVTFAAEDTFAPLTDTATDTDDSPAADDPPPTVAPASPAKTPTLTAIGGN